MRKKLTFKTKYYTFMASFILNREILNKNKETMMSVTTNLSILHLHPFLDLSLVHAAIGTYPISSDYNKMAVNRSLWILGADGPDAGFIRDLASGKGYRMRAGYIYFIPCNHAIEQRFTERISFVSLQFNLSLANGTDIFENYGSCAALPRPELVTEAESLVGSDDTLPALCGLNRLLFRLIGTLIEKSRGMYIENVPETWKKYAPALSYVRKYCTAKTTVAGLAHKCGMRTDVFSRSFTRDMKITPKALITRQVVRKASELLLQRPVKACAVAEELKFSSEYFFYRYFKKHTRMTPGQFRKLNGIGRLKHR